MTNRRRPRGVETYARILDQAVNIASTEGLGQMSLSTLAKAAGISKSGLFAHFQSKERLQLAIVDAAEERFFAAVHAGLDGAVGVDRVARFVEACVATSIDGPFIGGFFFASAVLEFDGRPGAVRDRIGLFYSHLRDAVTAIVDLRDVDAFMFRLHGTMFAANLEAQLHGRRDGARERGRAAVRSLVAQSFARE